MDRHRVLYGTDWNKKSQKEVKLHVSDSGSFLLDDSILFFWHLIYILCFCLSLFTCQTAKRNGSESHWLHNEVWHGSKTKRCQIWAKKMNDNIVIWISWIFMLIYWVNFYVITILLFFCPCYAMEKVDFTFVN